MAIHELSDREPGEGLVVEAEVSERPACQPQFHGPARVGR